MVMRTSLAINNEAAQPQGGVMSNEWLMGLAAALDQGGKTDEAALLRNMLGDTGDGGIGKIVETYVKENPVPLGELTVPIKVTEFSVVSEPKFPDATPGTPEAALTVSVMRGKVSTDFGDGLGGKIVKGVLFNVGLTTLLGIGG
jgi:hypothetical protein